MTKEQKIEEIRESLTGNLFADADLLDQIRELEIELGIVDENCSLEDEGCDSCGS